MTPTLYLGRTHQRQFEAIQQFDACALSNAIEEFGLRLRTEGYMPAGTVLDLPELPAMLGYAVPSHIKCANPPHVGTHISIVPFGGT